jgi:hypothetical protein
MIEHPITPPPKLVSEWAAESLATQHLCTQAARWGADQELEACCEYIGGGACLRAARRTKPPSLKEQSIALLDKIQSNKQMWQLDELDIIRRALEAIHE